MTVLDFFRHQDNQDARLLRAVLIYTAWHSGEPPNIRQLRGFYEHLYCERVPESTVRHQVHALAGRGLLAARHERGRNRNNTWLAVTDLGRAWQRRYP